MICRLLTRCPRRVPCIPAITCASYTRGHAPRTVESLFAEQRTPAEVTSWSEHVYVVRLGLPEPRAHHLIRSSILPKDVLRTGTYAPKC